MQTEISNSNYAVNARFLAHRVTGIQRYAREIASRLPGAPAMLAPANGKGARGHLWEQTALPRLAAGQLLWSPCGAGPLAYSRQVVTFHDLFPIEHPEWYSAAYAAWYSFMFRRLAAQAVHLIAVSAYTKNRIVKLLGRNPDEITVVHNGPAASTRLTTPLEAARAAQALALPSRRYVLSLSSLEARKNLPTILDAWRQAQRSLPDTVWLVLAGAQADASVFGKQKLSSIPARVHFTGYVPEEHLAGLYSGASLFLFPSLAEGFGLPLLEAMSCGLRAITSNNSSLPEVGGDAAVYLDPLNVRGIAGAILRHMPSTNAAATPFAPALAQAARFCWSDAASRTADVLERAAAARRIETAGRRAALEHGMSRLKASTTQPLRFALVHDWLTGMRGGEKVLEVLCRLYPDAPLWTLLHNRGTVCSTIENRPVHTSLLQHMPQAAKRYRSYLPLFPLFAEANKAHGVDVVVSTSHAVAKSMVRRKTRQQPLHICYIHTPMRYVWDLFDEYFGPARVGALASKLFFAPIARLLQRYDRATTDRVDLFVANSSYVAERVRRIYGRAAIVLPPPVDVERYSSAVREPGERYLVISALVPYKRVDHAIRACAALGRKLTIVGRGPEEARLRALTAQLGASHNIEFTGFASNEQLAEYYRQARALLFPGVEDFGIVPVEAIACGCPVLALAEGGVLDSMTPDTAVFYHEQTPEALEHAMLRFEARPDDFNPATLRARAAEFSEAQFVARFTGIVAEAIAGCANLQRHTVSGKQNGDAAPAEQGSDKSDEGITAQVPVALLQ